MHRLTSKSSIEPSEAATWQPLGTILRPHGIRGGLRVRLASSLSEWAAWPIAVAIHSNNAPPTYVRLTRWRSLPRSEALVELVSPLEREALNAFCGAPLWCTTDVLPPAGDTQIYLFELLHRPAVDQHGAALGTISAVYDHGAGALLGIESDAGEERLLPMAIVSIRSVGQATNGQGNDRAVCLNVPEELSSQW